MMRRSALNVLVLGLTAGCAPQLTAVQWTGEVDLSTVPSQEDYPKADAVELLNEVQFRMTNRWTADDHTEARVRKVIAILTEKGQARADVRVLYSDGEKIERFEARTIAPDGTIMPVKPNRVFDDDLTKREESEEGSDRKVRVFSFSDVKVGSIIDYTFVIQAKVYYSRIFWHYRSNDPIKKARFSVSGTKDLNFRVKAYNSDVPFDKSFAGEYWTVKWQLDDIPAEIDEAHRRGYTFQVPQVELVITSASKYTWDVPMFESWDSALTGRADDLYYDNDGYYAGFAPEIDFTDCKDVTCKVERSMAFLTENYPLRGWGGWPGRNAKKATDAKRGSVFEKSRLLWKILKDQGVKSTFAFTNRYMSDFVDKKFPARAGNHLILRVDQQPGLANAIWVDASCEYCAVGEVPIWLKKARVLLVEGTKPPPELETKAKTTFVKLDAPINSDESMDDTYEVSVVETGDAKVAMERAYTGREAMDYRGWFLRQSADELKENATDTAQKAHPSASLTSHANPAPDSRKAARTLSFDAPGYATVDEGRLLVPMTLMQSGWDETFQKDNERDLKIAFKRPFRRSQTATIRVPDGYEIKAVPAARKAEAAGLEVTITSARENGAVVVSRRLEIKPGLYKKDKYDALKKALSVFSSVRKDVVELAPLPKPEPVATSPAEPGSEPATPVAPAPVAPAAPAETPKP